MGWASQLPFSDKETEEFSQNLSDAMKTEDNIECKISTAIEHDDAITLRQTIDANSLAGQSLLDGWLSVASELGHLSTMCVLLDHGVNVNWTNCDGETAFSYTCARNQFAAAKLLHLHGANINSVDSSGGTPLDWAVCHGHPDFRAWLRSIGYIRNFDWDEWPWPPLGEATPNPVQ